MKGNGDLMPLNKHLSVIHVPVLPSHADPGDRGDTWALGEIPPTAFHQQVLLVFMTCGFLCPQKRSGGYVIQMGTKGEVLRPSVYCA